MDSMEAPAPNGEGHSTGLGMSRRLTESFGVNGSSSMPLKILGAGVSLYVLVSIASWLTPSGVLGGIFLVGFGVVLGVVALPLILVGAFYVVTKEGTIQQSTREAGPNVSWSSALPVDQKDKQQQYDDVVKEMFQASGKAAPPHRLYEKGLYNGWLWTIPSSQYDRKDAIVNWPPATEGPKKIATRWWASLRGTTLYMAKSSSLQETYQVPVLEVDLTDCKVEIVTDALKSKSKWWRKCPLAISHPTRQVLHSETSVAVFAEGSAAKEQWYIALKTASGQASSVETVKQSYQCFCNGIRAGVPELYPQVGGEATGSAKAQSLEDSARSSSPTKSQSLGQPGKWGRLFSKKPRRGPPQDNLQMKSLGRNSGTPRSASPSKKEKAASRFLSPMELDSAWMGKGAVPKHIAVPAASPTQAQATAQPTVQEPLEGEADCQKQSDHSEGSPKKVEHSAQSLPSLDLHEKIELRKPSPSILSVETSGPHAPAQQENISTPKPDAPPTPQSLDGPVGTELPEANTMPETPHTKMDNLLPIECAINMLLVRGAFDVLRSPAVNAALKAHVHKKLNELRFPTWLHGIEVHEIQTGTTAPRIHNLKAMPYTGSSIWPQVLFDFEYEGEITVVIETKLDVRDGVAWSQLGKAIGRLEGSAGADQRQALADQDSDSDTEIDPPGKSPETPTSSDASQKPRTGLLANIMPLRQKFAQSIRQVAEVAADHVSRMQLKLRLDIRSLKGPMYAWLPPPPGDRLWFSFVEPPKLIAAATPLVGGRLLKYSYQAGRVSQWVGSKMQSSIAKNMVFPSCSDIPIKVLIGVDHPEVAVVPPAFPTNDVGKSKVPKDPKEDLQNLDTEGLEGVALPKNEVERAASLENQAIIDTSHEPPSQHTKAPGSKTVKVSPLSQPEKPSSAKKEGFWARRKSAKKLSPVKGVSQDAVLAEGSQSPENTTPTKSSQGAMSSSGTEGTQPSPTQLSAKVPADVAPPLGEELGGKPNPVNALKLASEHLHVSAPSGGDSSDSPASSSPPCNPTTPGDAKQEGDGLASGTGWGAERTEDGPGRSAVVASNDQASLDNTHAADPAQPSQAGGLSAQQASQPGETSSVRQAYEIAKTALSQPEIKGREETTQASPEVKAAPQGVPASSEEAGTASSPAAKPHTLSTSDEAVQENLDLDPLGGFPVERRSETEKRGTSEPAHQATDVESGHILPARDETRPASVSEVIEIRPSQGSEHTRGPAEDTDPTGEGAMPEPSPNSLVGRKSVGWSERWNVTGSRMQSHWNAFKTKNPQTVQQGMKLAGAVEKLKDQAQEQYRKAQEASAKKKHQESHADKAGTEFKLGKSA